MGQTISQLASSGALTGVELVEVSKLSPTILITASTISAQASDNSFNDSGAGFVTAGFAVNDHITVSGFTGNVANNLASGRISALTTSKMTIASPDGDLIVDDAAGESVTITKWLSRRTTAADLGGAGASVAAQIVAAAAKTTPIAADSIGIVDSADSNALKEVTFANLQTFFRTPSIQAVTSSATVTPTFSDDMVKITAQAAALALANPTGTAIPGLGMVIRIKDNGTARAISYDTQYRAIGITLPTTTVISKTTYLAMIYNSDDTKWDVIATGTEA